MPSSSYFLIPKSPVELPHGRHIIATDLFEVVSETEHAETLGDDRLDELPHWAKAQTHETLHGYLELLNLYLNSFLHPDAELNEIDIATSHCLLGAHFRCTRDSVSQKLLTHPEAVMPLLGAEGPAQPQAVLPVFYILRVKPPDEASTCAKLAG